MTHQDIAEFKKIMYKLALTSDIILPKIHNDNPATGADHYNLTIKWLRSYVERDCLKEFECSFALIPVKQEDGWYNMWILWIRNMLITWRD